MGLSIKNDAVEAMIRDLAAARGVSMTEAVRLAVAAELARAAEDRAAMLVDRRARLDAIVAEFRKLPILDNRTPEEIWGYDENGLPT
jgi:antitoxin VapB